MRILSIQSSVAYGHAGNSAAVFPLRRLGHEVWPVNTVHFSNHTGYGDFRGIVHDPAAVADVIRGVGERGVLGEVDAVLTGYQGSPGVAEVVLDTVRQVKELNPQAVYCCDPVMGDRGKGMYVADGIPEMLRDRVVPAADILVPNAFELAYIAGSGGDPATAIPADISTDSALLRAVDVVREMGPRIVLVTSIEDGGHIPAVMGGSFGPGDTGELFGAVVAEAGFEGLGEPEPSIDAADGTISMIAVTDAGAWKVSHPKLPLLINGGGDVTTAVFLAHWSTDGVEKALARTAATMHTILAATAHRMAAGTDVVDRGAEIALVASQDAIAHPVCDFVVQQLR